MTGGNSSNSAVTLNALVWAQPSTLVGTTGQVIEVPVSPSRAGRWITLQNKNPSTAGGDAETLNIAEVRQAATLFRQRNTGCLVILASVAQ